MLHLLEIMNAENLHHHITIHILSDGPYLLCCHILLQYSVEPYYNDHINIIYLFLGTNLKHISIYNQYTRKSDFAGKLFSFLIQLTIICFIILPGLEGQLNKLSTEVQNATYVKKKALPLNCWLPFDKYNHYYLSYTLTGITAAYGGYFTIATDVFFYALIIFCTGQLRILQEQLKEFKAKPTRDNFTADQEKIIIENLRECVKQHKIIIK